MICTKGDASAANLKIMETFYNGLSDRTKLEMARLNINNITEMYQIIEVTENTMMKQMMDSEQHKSLHRREKMKRREKGRQDTWCEYHRISTHNTNECREKKEFLSKKRDKHEYETNAFSFIVPKVNTQSLDLSAQIGIKYIKATVDTGATYSFINEGKIKDMSILRIKSPKIYIQLVDEIKLTSNGKN
ncbi:hypothetical protein DMUE_0561 [Dictyocoela muelleri]|nr:hypothetical protein DMUE_0561 [Dictyocoela muelleri]